MREMKLYCVGMICYASSHDDFIGIFSTKEKAEAACRKFNDKYAEENLGTPGIPDEEFPWGAPPYYMWEEDVSKYRGYINEDEPLLERWPKWTAIYQVPSLGRFSLVPTNTTAIEEYEVDKCEF